MAKQKLIAELPVLQVRYPRHGESNWALNPSVSKAGSRDNAYRYKSQNEKKTITKQKSSLWYCPRTMKGACPASPSANAAVAPISACTIPKSSPIKKSNCASCLQKPAWICPVLFASVAARPRVSEQMGIVRNAEGWPAQSGFAPQSAFSRHHRHKRLQYRRHRL